MTEQEKTAWTRTYILNARINAYKSLPELRFNPYHDDKGRFTTKAGNCLTSNKNNGISDRKAYSENNAKNGLTSTGNGSIMKTNNKFHCYGDYLREKLGSAKDNNAKELKEIIDDVKSKGGNFIFLKNNPTMVCDVMKEKPGTIKVDENASIGGIKHEYRHFLDDYYNECPGLAYYLKDSDIFFNFEKRGYEEELKIAKEKGYDDIVKKIENEIEKRKCEIYGE